MRWPGGLEFLEQARAKPLYMVNDSIFAPVSAGGKMVMRRRGTLSAHAKALAARTQAQAGVSLPASERAREYLSVLDELNFVLRELLPYLRFLVTEDDSCLACSHVLDSALTQLSCRGSALQDMLGPPPRCVVPGDLLERLFHVPCMIIGEIVIPLECVGPLSQSMAGIEIGGTNYGLRMSHLRPLQPIVAEVRRSLTSLVQGINSGDRRLDQAVNTWCRELQQVLHAFGLRSAGPNHLVYRDRYHELHCRRGHFVLARGPVLGRGARGMRYIAIAIKGKSRKQRLSLCPAVAHAPQQFWTPPGAPVLGGICMGNRAQYWRLLSHQFTDAEATVHWLDAGVRIVTGTSVLHRRLFRASRSPVRSAPIGRR